MELFTGTTRLMRLVLRRDRIKLPLWIIGIVSFAAMMVPTLKQAYGTPADWQMIYGLMEANVAMTLFAGNMDEVSFGAVFTMETILYVGLLIAFMNTLLVIRHTRQNEELGSAELLQSARVGRFASLNAVLVVAVIANSVLAGGLAAVLLPEALFTTSNALLYSLAMGLFGISFAAIAAVTAQLSSSSRGANGLAAMVIGVTFLLRGIGDVLATTDSGGVIWPHWASWLSPFGWLQLARPLTLEHWWALGIPVGFGVVAVGIAYALLARRDVGAGILPAKKGHARASGLLRHPIGLVLRLQRGVLIGWAIAAVVTAVTVGAMAHQVEKMLGGSETIQQYVAALGGVGEMTTAFMSAMLTIIAVMVLAYVIQALQRLRTEEVQGYTESLLGTALGRARWMLSHLAVAVVGASAIMVISSVALAVTAGLTMGEPITAWRLGDYALAGASYVPVLVLGAAIFAALFGALPKAAALVTWIGFAFVVFISQLGAMLKLPEWILDLFPLTHIAAAPAASIEFVPVVVITGSAVILIGAGIVLFGRRDTTNG